MASRVIGVREYRAALKVAPEHLREATFEAIKETVEGVYTRGRANITSMTKRQSGVLLKNYRRRTSKKTLKGRVGYLTPSARRKAFYARFVHDGTAKMGERRFHGNAVDSERDKDTRRMIAARNRVVTRLTQGGALTLRQGIRAQRALR